MRQRLTAGMVWRKAHEADRYILHWKTSDLATLPQQRQFGVISVNVRGESEGTCPMNTVNAPINNYLAITGQ